MSEINPRRPLSARLWFRIAWLTTVLLAFVQLFVGHVADMCVHDLGAVAIIDLWLVGFLVGGKR